MKTKITDIELKNWTCETTLALLRHGRKLSVYGEIMNIAEMGLMENTVHWEENLNGETRKFINAQINAPSYVVSVLSKDYDLASKTGDTMLIRITKDDVKMNLWGVLTKVTRNRFEKADENTWLYKTDYEIFCSNPLWRFEATSGPALPSEYEVDNMELIYTGVFDMTQSLSTLSTNIDTSWFNTKRGFKMELKFDTTVTGTKPGTGVRFVFAPIDYSFTMTPTRLSWRVTDTLLAIFAQSLISTNMTPSSYPNWTSTILTEYTDGNTALLSPAMWDDENTVFKISQISHLSEVSDLTLTVKIYLEKGWYF